MRLGLLRLTIGAAVAPGRDAGRPRGFALLVLAAASWGIGTVLSKRAVAELPPITLLAAQLWISVAVLGLLAAWRRTRLSVDRRLALLGALNPGLAYALSLVGLTTIGASVSVLIWAIEPILILLLAAAVLREHPDRQTVVLSGVAFGGLVIVLAQPDARIAAAGVAATVAGVACCAVYSVAARRWIPDAPSTLAVVLAQQAIAAVLVIVVLLVAVIISAVPSANLTGAGIASVVASGVLYYGAAYLLYLSALRHLPVAVAAIGFYLVPVFGVAVAVAAGESLSAIQWSGAVITVAAVIAVGTIEIRRGETT